MPNFKFQISNFKFLGMCYILGIIALFFYSFTQVDLSLTLSKASWVQEVQRSFQYIGYFNRPVSTYLFVGIILFLYFFYVRILFSLKHISSKQLWSMIIFSTLLLALAYNAFSYDLFNYIFDAKIFTYYQLNPYEHKALDFAQEPMVSFMRWTHRVYPYGPVWLGLTIPLSFLGLNYFLVTFFLFKSLMAFCFLGTVWCIGKILQKISPHYEKLGIAFFALNPFVLIESLVSAHNDIVMLFFLLLGIYFLVQKRYLLTFIALVLGYGIKFASPEFPLVIHAGVIAGFALGLVVFAKIQKKVSWDIICILALCVMILLSVFASFRTNFQPWYILVLFPFVALISKKIFIVASLICLSLFALAEYIPYLYTGNWDPPIPTILSYVTGIGIVSSVVIGSITAIIARKR